MARVNCSSAIADITCRGACSLAAGTALAVAFVALCRAVSVAVGAVFHICEMVGSDGSSGSQGNELQQTRAEMV
jgi:hypothetical protein